MCSEYYFAFILEKKATGDAEDGINLLYYRFEGIARFFHSYHICRDSQPKATIPLSQLNYVISPKLHLIWVVLSIKNAVLRHNK